MHGLVNSRLATFNTLALQFQDEAYTLAYYLLGDEVQADTTTQAVFSRLFGRLGGVRLDQFRFEVLHGVLENCKHQGHGLLARATVQDELCHTLLNLKISERFAVVLVDVLGLDYDECARVMGCPTRDVKKLLAQGRLALGKQAGTSLIR